MSLERILLLLKNNAFSYWWPIDFEYLYKNNGDWRVEVIIGAILTQNTKWKFVENTLNILRNNNFSFRFEDIKNINIEYIKVPFKERKLKTLIELSNFILDFGLENIIKEDTKTLRKDLLNIKGIGNETADVILLYAFEKPSFVIDKYTKDFLQMNNISYLKLKDIIEKFIDENFIEIDNIFKNKEINKEFCDKLNKYKNIPLYPCHYKYSNNIEKKIIIYKELHGMIDEYMKNSH